ncbi:ABC transporter permease [Bacillus sp. JCM 19034]|uniref:ABC transporter permease n=1 Tax=Bacillus sp. JCM 19034 TaxID=1481928 RepID=UPI0007835487|nr:ABC transporter permease subunit [Bacillus sp. JCM 19034]
MRTFLILFTKEMQESIRNGKWIWLPITLIVIGISQPITSYYMPQLLEMAGNLPEGTVIELPTPSGAEVLSGTLSQYGMIGTLLFILASMNMIAHERRNGSLTFIMVRPVHSVHFILSKYVAHFFILSVSMFLSYLLTWYYTNVLFSSVSFEIMIKSFLTYHLWLLLTIAVVTFVSTVIKQSGGIAGVSVVALVGITVLSQLLPKYMEWSPANLSNEAMFILMNEPSSHFWIVCTSSLIITALLVIAAIFQFQRSEHHQADQ